MWKAAEQLQTEFSTVQTSSPNAILVFPILWGRLLWVRHPTRGWEVPGGKVEQNESPLDAVCREAWEESGVTLQALDWIAEYAIPEANGNHTYKWVYIGAVKDVQARPDYSEIIDVRLWNPPILPEDVHKRSDVSPIMKDIVFETLWPMLQQHPLFQQNS